MLIVVYTIFWVCAGLAFLAWMLRFPRRLGKHRGTPGQLALQAERRAEQEAEYAQAIVRADLIANGSRADWITVEG